MSRIRVSTQKITVGPPLKNIDLDGKPIAYVGTDELYSMYSIFWTIGPSDQEVFQAIRDFNDAVRFDERYINLKDTPLDLKFYREPGYEVHVPVDAFLDNERFEKLRRSDSPDSPDKMTINAPYGYFHFGFKKIRGGDEQGFLSNYFPDNKELEELVDAGNAEIEYSHSIIPELRGYIVSYRQLSLVSFVNLSPHLPRLIQKTNARQIPEEVLPDIERGLELLLGKYRR